LERRRIRKEKQKELEKKKSILKNKGNTSSERLKSRFISKKYAIILIAIVVTAIAVPILIIFLTPTVGSTVFVESDNLYYTYQDGALEFDFINSKYSLAASGVMVDAIVSDKFNDSYTLIDTNITRTCQGNYISIKNFSSGTDQSYTIIAVPNIDYNAYKISDGIMSYPSSLWWNHNVTNTELDLFHDTDLYNYVKKPILITSLFPDPASNLTGTHMLNLKLTVEGGSSLTGNNKIDFLQMSFSFRDQDNVSFSNPIAINSSLFINDNEITFTKTIYDFNFNYGQAILEFNLTINCLNNFTNLNLINPQQNAQIFIQIKDKLITHIYDEYIGPDEAQIDPINDISSKAKEAWSNLVRYKYLNLFYRVPLIYNATI